MVPVQVVIRTVAPAEMRYQTVGDWQMKGHTLFITVADSGDQRTNLVVALHEAIEAVLYLEHGGSEKAVDEFDEAWRNDTKYDEAGKHVLATIIERLLVREMGMSWEAHEMFVERADNAVKKARKKAQR